MESANQELQSSNEELLSLNEELQSANEELQSSKEEVQTVNAELESVNRQLTNKVEELGVATSDMEGLFEGAQLATIFLDNDLLIKRFTPAATEVFHLRPGDVGRPVTDITARFTNGDVVAEIREVLRTLQRREVTVTRADDGNRYLMRILRTARGGTSSMASSLVRGRHRAEAGPGDSGAPQRRSRAEAHRHCSPRAGRRTISWRCCRTNCATRWRPSRPTSTCGRRENRPIRSWSVAARWRTGRWRT